MPDLPSPTLRRLYDASGCARWSVSSDAFARVLRHIATHHGVSDDELPGFLDRLHLEDVGLAVACQQGDERAWEHFVGKYTPVLRRAADAIDPTGGTRELADALFGDLFGATEREGVRHSLLAHYHGRSSLATWLRAVLARRHVDRLRATRRLDALPDDESQPARTAAGAATLSPGSTVAADEGRFRSAFRRALDAAIGTLDPRDRLRLGCYYAQHLTLAQIGRLLGEHEATVSRQLTRVRRVLKSRVEDALRRGEGLDAAVVEEGFAAVVEDAGDLDLAELLPEPRKVARLVRSDGGANS